MRSIVLTTLLLACIGFAAASRADTQDEISTALDYYAEVWNEGDTETIRGYYHPDFVLVTAQGPVPLAQRISDIQSISRTGEDRGEMSYSDVKIVALADGHALAYGKIRLAFKDGSSIESWFSTVYAKTPFGWKAILTHQ